MAAQLWIPLSKEVNMVRHDLHLDDLRLPFADHLLEDGFQAIIDPIHQNPTTVLRAPHDMVLAGIHHSAVRREFPSHG